jgi:hypothetical protein
MSKPETMLSVWPANGGDVSIALTGKAMKVHPLCLTFSTIAPLSKQERAEMLEDIKQNGIKIPILINEAGDTIIDGYTRWKIAYDLGLRKSQVPIQRFKCKAEEIEGEILSRNLFRRHMTDDQRLAIFAKVKGPQLEKEAAERKEAGRKAGGKARHGQLKHQNSISSFSEGSEAYVENKISDPPEEAYAENSGKLKSDADSCGKELPEGGSVAAQIAQRMGVSQRKAEQIEKARKAGMLDEVITGEQRLREAAAKTGKKRKDVPFEDAVYKKWSAWLNRFAPEQRRVMELIHDWIRAAS